MPLSQAQLDEYNQQGFTIVPDLFSAADVAVMQEELARLQSEGLLRNVATAGDGTTPTDAEQNLQICPLSPKSEVFRSLLFTDQITDLLAKVYGDEPAYHRLDQIFLKPPLRPEQALAGTRTMLILPRPRVKIALMGLGSGSPSTTPMLQMVQCTWCQTATKKSLSTFATAAATTTSPALIRLMRQMLYLQLCQLVAPSSLITACPTAPRPTPLMVIVQV